MNSEDRELFERLRSVGVCPFCERDPHEYVDIGVGMQPVAITCCEYGIALFQYGDKQLVDVNCRMNDAATRLESLCGEVERLKEARRIVDEQAEDESLWAVPITGMQPISEAHLQQELRRLHTAVEGKTPEECARAALSPSDGDSDDDSGANTLL